MADIPDEAVERAVQAAWEAADRRWAGGTLPMTKLDMRAALEAAYPLLPKLLETVHLIADGEAVTSCCGRTPFELPRDERITSDPALRSCVIPNPMPEENKLAQVLHDTRESHGWGCEICQRDYECAYGYVKQARAVLALLNGEN